jgi:murein DD-endopeptidase MepM/ murein hydrolase activator NlpD
LEDYWINPVDSTVVTSSFGTRINPITRRQEFHNGIDIAAGLNSPVRAVKDGKITRTGYSSTWGNYIEYKTDTGYLIFKAHLSKVLVNDGEVVLGQEIAKAGSTGLSTGPHLHLSIYKDETATDPFYFFNLHLSNAAKAEYIARGEPLPDGN